MIPVLFVRWRLAETEKEGASARLKRTWQSEVTGLGMEEEAGVAGKDKLTSD